MIDDSAHDSSAALYRATLDALPEPILVYDDTQVLYANAAACAVLGAGEPSRLVGMNVQDFVLPDLAEVNNSRRGYVIEQGVELRDVQVKIRGLDGQPTVLRLDIRPISFGGTRVAMATLAHA